MDCLCKNVFHKELVCGEFPSNISLAEELSLLECSFKRYPFKLLKD